MLDPNGTPTENGFKDAFDEGILLGAEGRVTIKPFVLVGHQLIGFMWSNEERTSLIQDPSNLARLLITPDSFPRLSNPGPVLERILERFYPELLVPVQPLNTEGGYWTLCYTTSISTSGARRPIRIEAWGWSSVSTGGLANAVKHAFNVGMGGKGIVPGRPDDTFGIGWSRVTFSDDLLLLLRQRLDLGLDHEDAIEMYYNAAITRSLGVSLDLQIVEPGLKKTLSSSGRLEDVNPAVVGALRLYMRF